MLQAQNIENNQYFPLLLNPNGGNVGIATTTPAAKLVVNGLIKMPYYTITQPEDVVNKSYVDSTITAGTASSSQNSAACSIDTTCEMNGANLQNGNITGVNKISVATIDPLYQIGNTKYATYAASIAGGVKEEYVGRAKLSHTDLHGLEDGFTRMEYAIDFDKVQDGSDLWVWRKTVDFSDDTVQVIATPVKTPVSIAYEINGNKIIFTARIQNSKFEIPNSISFSYRLTGNRFDWQKWPTLAKDQTERALLIIK
ncbi:MAG: hypothetical protein V1656_00745 [Candidatus Jorgensenbacteria bacterium]